MPNGNSFLISNSPTQFAIPHSSNIVSLPYASEIEKTMYWLDRVAVQNQWTTNYSSNELINSSGFNWKRYNGINLEVFTPNSGESFELTGYPIHSKEFWEYYRRIIQFVGDKTLRYYDLYGGQVSGLQFNRYSESGYKWKVDSDGQWKTYGNYIGSPYNSIFRLDNLNENSFVDYHDSSKINYMGRHGNFAQNDYRQYTPTTTQTNFMVQGPFRMARRSGYEIYTYYPSGGVNTLVSGQYTSFNSEFNNGTWQHIKALVSGNLEWNLDDNGLITKTVSYYHGTHNNSFTNWTTFTDLFGHVTIVSGHTEQHQINCAFEEDFWFSLIPLSRKFYATGSGDIHHYSDTSHYLSSFTGFSPNDSLDYSYRIKNITLSGATFLQADLTPIYTMYPLISVSSCLIYGYLNFDPVIHSGGYGLVGREIVQKVNNGDFRYFSRHPKLTERYMVFPDNEAYAVECGPRMQTVTSTTSYSGFFGSYPEYGYIGDINNAAVYQPDTKYQSENKIYGSFAPLLEQPSGNLLFIACINEKFNSLPDFMDLPIPTTTFANTYSVSPPNNFITRLAYGGLGYNAYYLTLAGSGMATTHQNSSFGAVGASNAGQKNQTQIGSVIPFGILYSDTKTYGFV